MLKYFDNNRLYDFFKFCMLRQSVWYKRRVLQADPPWTTDKTLANYRFTNVIREQDKGTIFAERIHEHALSNPEHAGKRAAFSNLLFNIMIYRLIGLSDTYEEIGYTSVDNWSRDRFVATLKNRRKRGDNIFTGSYLVSPYHHLGYEDRLDALGELFSRVVEWLNTPGAAAMLTSTHPEELFKAIKSNYGFGAFLAYQVAIDMMYAAEKFGLPYNNNTWAHAGPGAKKGINFLLKKQHAMNAPSNLRIMEWLRNIQDVMFGIISGSEGIIWHDSTMSICKNMHIGNIEHALCEYSKYYRINNGKAKGQGRFDPDHTAS